MAAIAFDPSYLNNSDPAQRPGYTPSYMQPPAQQPPPINQSLTSRNAFGMTESVGDKTFADTPAGKGIGAGISQGTAALTGMAKEQGAASAAQYVNDYGTWQGQEPYYFNPNSDVAPDLEGYMKKYPSKLDALQNSDMFSRDYKKNWTDPIAAATSGSKQGSYIYSQAAKGVTEGFTSGGGWVGGVVGGVVGLVKGIFAWDDAETQDSKSRAAALTDYNNKMKEWTRNRRKMMDDQNAQAAMATQGIAQQQEQNAIQGQKSKRSIMMGLIQGSANQQPQYRPAYMMAR
jgi:hypothetical protein